MKHFTYAALISLLIFGAPVKADKFVNTGPGTINSCDSTGAVGVGVSDTDSLLAPGRTSLLMVGANNSTSLGGALQLNMPPNNASARAAMFEIYMHGGSVPVVRLLKSISNSGASREEISNWDLSSNAFWAKGEIRSDVGFRAGGTALNVPDFVFEPDYKLRSLEETERFVKTHRHLPDIPNAEEVRINGLDLAEMNLKLLQKVEELTLYAIQQDKRIQALETVLRESSVVAVVPGKKE